MRRGYVRSSLPTESAYLCGSLNTQSLLLTPGDGFLKSRKHFLSPSAGATELITQAPSKEYREHCRLFVSLFKIDQRADTGSQKDHNILPPGVGVPLRGWQGPEDPQVTSLQPTLASDPGFRLFPLPSTHIPCTMLLCACVIFKSLWQKPWHKR